MSSYHYRIGFCFLFLVLPLPAVLAYFEGCDNEYQLGTSSAVVQSPYYPKNYPAGTSCRYKFVAPLDYYIQVECSMNIPQTNNKCTTDNFYLDNEGDLLMRGSENFCGQGSFTRQSLFREVVFAYISEGTQTGQFQCKLTPVKQPCSCGWSISTRIANGQAAAANEVPSMVALKNTQSNVALTCGGSIVSHRHIVTAAHCVGQFGPIAQMVAIVGTNNLKNPTSSRYYNYYNLQQPLVHEQYRSEPSMINDIAVLVTTKNIEWSRGVGPVCLPPPSTTDDFSYDTVNVYGFGSVFFAGPTSPTLQKINLMVTSNSDCQTQYNGIATINSGHMCTYDYSGTARDSCQYDSGGPCILSLSKQFLVGLISFGQNCAATRYPMGVNTRITAYIGWIRQKIGNTNCVVSM